MLEFLFSPKINTIGGSIIIGLVFVVVYFLTKKIQYYYDIKYERNELSKIEREKEKILQEIKNKAMDPFKTIPRHNVGTEVIVVPSIPNINSPYVRAKDLNGAIWMTESVYKSLLESLGNKDFNYCFVFVPNSDGWKKIAYSVRGDSRQYSNTTAPITEYWDEKFFRFINDPMTFDDQNNMAFNMKYLQDFPDNEVSKKLNHVRNCSFTAIDEYTVQKITNPRYVVMSPEMDKKYKSPLVLNIEGSH